MFAHLCFNRLEILVRDVCGAFVVWSHVSEKLFNFSVTSTTSDPFTVETEANDTLDVDCFTKF
jgi:hypothetical protein